MKDALINQNINNNINHENQAIQGQYQPNQPSVELLGVNQSSYTISSSQNLNTPYSNTTPNQTIDQGYSNPYQNPPYMQFNMLINGMPFTDTSGQLNLQPKAENNINYENIKNMSELTHLKFTQPEDNTFILNRKFMIIFPFWIIFFNIPMIILPFIMGIPYLFFFYIPVSIWIAVSITMCFKLIISIYFILGPNSITVNKNSILRKKTYIYNSDELLRVEYHQNMKDTGKGPRFVYEIVFVKANGVPDKIYEEQSSPFDFHEIGYFIHIINKHIQTNMITK